jgi:hypothetical protein
MIRKSLICLTPMMMGTFALTSSQLLALPPDPGTIVTTSTATAGKMRSWVFRSGDDAFVINVQPKPFSSDFKAYIRQYKKGTSEFAPTALKLKIDPAAGAPSVSFNTAIELALEKNIVSGNESYTMTYVNAAGVITKVGVLRFVGGGNGRASADLIARFDAKVTSIVFRDPCVGPPADDMGEEEEISLDGSSVPLQPVASAPVGGT